MIADLIKAQLDGEADRGHSSKAGVLRMSEAGKCARKQVYSFLGVKAKPLSARGQLVFLLGHLIESVLVDATVKAVPGFKAGIESVQVIGGKEYPFYSQPELFTEVEGLPVVGHPDGWLEDEEGNVVTVVDFKSMSNRSFMDAKKGILDVSYIAQAHMYMKALDIKESIFVCFRKETSHLCEAIVLWSNEEWEKIVARYGRIKASLAVCKKAQDAIEHPELLPEKEYGPNMKGKLPWNCSYCDHCKTCWPGCQVKISSEGAPEVYV